MGRMYPDIFPRRWPTLQDSILAMFAGSAAGAWYDPSDLATMFTAASGLQQPVTASGDVVGLMLDKRFGAVRSGPQLVPNPTFASSGSGWLVSGTDGTHIVTFLNPGARYQSDTTSPQLNIDHTLVLTAGQWFEAEVEISAYVSGSVKIFGTVECTIPPSVGTHRVRFLAQGTTLRIYRNSTNVDLTIASIRVWALPGNHAYQLTGGSRPVYRVENYNLLTFTRDLTNAAWSKVGASVTANSWTPTAGSPELVRAAAVVISAGQRFTISGRFKPLGDAVGVILYSTQGGNGLELKVNLRTGRLISWAALGTGAINDFAISGNPIDGYTLYASGGLDPAGTAAQWRVKLCDAAGVGVTANGVDGLQIDGAQLVLGANAFRPYQWVDASGTFDQSQGRRYLESDGIDDSLRATFTDAQPIDRVSALQQVSWTGGDFIFGSVSANDAASVFQGGASPQIVLASNLSLALGAGPAIGEVAVLTERYDGVSSRGAINSGAYVSGNAGALAPGGITIGARYPPSNFGNINLYQLIMRGTVAGGMSDSQIAVCRAMCAAKGGVTL